MIVLDASGREVARKSGPVEVAALVRWLNSGRKLAIHEPDEVLVSVEAPTRTEIKELIESMADSSPEIREIAIERMAIFPEKTRPAAVDALRGGNLATRLSLIDLLNRWQAPIEGIDAWDMTSLTDARAESLKKWCETPVEELSKALETVTPEQLANANEQLDRFLKDSGEISRLLPAFSRYGKHLLPQVYRRFGQTDSDDQRQRLLARALLVGGQQSHAAGVEHGVHATGRGRLGRAARGGPASTHSGIQRRRRLAAGIVWGQRSIDPRIESAGFAEGRSAADR